MDLEFQVKNNIKFSCYLEYKKYNGYHKDFFSISDELYNKILEIINKSIIKEINYIVLSIRCNSSYIYDGIYLLKYNYKNNDYIILNEEDDTYNFFDFVKKILYDKKKEKNNKLLF